MSAVLTDISLPTCNQSDSSGIVHHMEEDGCVIIPNVLNKAQVEEMKRQIDALVHLQHDGGYQKTEACIDHYKCVFNRSPYWLQFIDMPGIIEAVEKMMGADCHIIGMSAWRTPPGIGNNGMHVDQLMFPVAEELLLSRKVKIPIFYSTLHFYLNDMDEDLCPTWVVPGSHFSGRGPSMDKTKLNAQGFVGGEEREWNGVKEVPVLVPAGDAMLFRSEVWHSGSVNKTKDRTRYLLQVHYARRGIAQRFPPYTEFVYNKEVLAAASDRQLRMLGKHKIGAYG